MSIPVLFAVNTLTKFKKLTYQMLLEHHVLNAGCHISQLKCSWDIFQLLFFITRDLNVNVHICKYKFEFKRANVTSFEESSWKRSLLSYTSKY